MVRRKFSSLSLKKKKEREKQLIFLFVEQYRNLNVSGFFNITIEILQFKIIKNLQIVQSRR